MASCQKETHPGRVTVFLSMTIRLIVHHLPVMYPSVPVYLPEDDTLLPRCAYTILTGGMYHLLPGQHSRLHYRLAELAVDRKGLPPQERRGMAVERRTMNVVQHGTE